VPRADGNQQVIACLQFKAFFIEFKHSLTSGEQHPLIAFLVIPGIRLACLRRGEDSLEPECLLF
jgi:hypothetical protein